jgi:hypothetical protein
MMLMKKRNESPSIISSREISLPTHNNLIPLHNTKTVTSEVVFTKITGFG